jgi:predicted DNA-binding protein (MmcQ/YjbR family)
VAADAYERVRRICARLPETVETQLDPIVRFKVRTRVVAMVFEMPGTPPMAVVWVDPEEREFLVRNGHPYFPIRNSPKRIGVVLDDATDWDEIAELVTESYRLTAPKALVAQLDDQP